MNEKLLFLFLLLPAALCAQVVLSEIMFNPEGNERYDEFIEIYNAGEQPIDLQGWQISDGTKTNRLTAVGGGTTVIRPRQYAVVLVPNYFLNSRRYNSVIPPEALLLTIDAAQIGAYGLNNTKGERVSLAGPNGEVSAYEYTPDNADGCSEEKIDLAGPDAPENWQNSRKKGGTPGSINSVAALGCDLELAVVTFTPEFPAPNDSLHLHLTLVNGGKNDIPFCTLIVEKTGDGSKELLRTILPLGLASKESLAVRIVLAPLPEGQYDLTITALLEGDENPINNRTNMIVTVEPPAAFPQVVINEIMYLTDERAEEWLELYNAGKFAVNLRKWTIADRKKSSALSDKDIFLPVDGYAVIAGTSPPPMDTTTILLSTALPELNNSGDDLYLCDERNRLIDAVSYLPSMGGGRDVSLERIDSGRPANDPKNWSSCQDSLGHTAGRRNSVARRRFDAAADVCVRIEPQKPTLGDQISIFVPVINCGLLPLDSITVSMRAERRVQPIQQKQLFSLAPSDTAILEFSWQADSAGFQSLIFYCQSRKDERPQNDSCRISLFVSPPVQSLIFSEILYNPPSGIGEGIELYNRSGAAINLLDWRVSDRDSAKKISISSASLLLPPGEFCVIAKDSSLLPQSGLFVTLNKFPSLANDADTLYLFDPNTRIHERVAYRAAWGGSRGRSLERIHPDLPADEPSNWTTCVDPSGNTLGRRNSICVEIQPGSSLLQASPNPFSPDGDGFEDLTAVSYKIPAAAAEVSLKIFDIRGRLVRFLLNYELSGFERTVFWDGRDDEGQICRMGIYIILLEARDKRAGTASSSRCTVVLAGRL